MSTVSVAAGSRIHRTTVADRSSMNVCRPSFIVTQMMMCTSCIQQLDTQRTRCSTERQTAVAVAIVAVKAPAASSRSLAARGLHYTARGATVAMCRANGNGSENKKSAVGWLRPAIETRMSTVRKFDLPVVASSSNGPRLKQKQTKWTRTHALS